MSDQVTRMEAGQAAPTFTLENQNGESLRSEDLFKTPTVLYFYPAAGSPGCTKEASDFEQQLGEFKALGYQVVGVSPDSVRKLKEFEEAHELTFTLLSDPDIIAHKAVGAYGQKSLYGRVYTGVLRSTILIRDGKVVDALYNVKATGHTNMLLKRLAR